MAPMLVRLSSLSLLDMQPIVFAFSLMTGAAVYFSLSFEPSTGVAMLVTLAVSVVAFLVFKLSSSNVLNVVILAFMGVSLGVAAAQTRTWRVESSKIEQATGPLMIEGWVRAVEPGAKGLRLLIEVHAMQRSDGEQLPKYIRLTHMSRLEVAPGRFVRCWSVLRPPPRPTLPGDYDFERQAYFRQLGAVGYVQGRCRGGAIGAPKNLMSRVSLRVGAFRHQLARSVYEAAGPEAGGFASAVVSGDRSYLTEDVQNDLRSSGLAHLLAISGLHMGLVGGLVYFIVFRCLVMIEYIALRVAVQKPAAAVALFASLSYLIVSGASVSTQRAFIMSAVVFGAILFDRSAISLRTFAVAMILVVLLQPESVVTPGFQMSFAASGGLIATYEAWNARRARAERPLGKMSFFVVSLLVTSIVATLSTAPFAIYHFGRTAPLSIFANLFAMPVITFVSAPLAALSLILSPFGLSDVPLQMFGRSLQLVQDIAARFSAENVHLFETPQQMPIASLWLIAVGMFLAGISRGAWRVLNFGTLFVTACAIWWWTPATVFHWSKSGDLFVSLEGDGRMVRNALANGDALPPLRYIDAPQLSPPEETGTLDLEWATMRFGDRDGEPNAMIMTPAGQNYVVTWSDVQKTDGVTASLTRLGRLQFHRSTCRNRPWRKCEKPN